MGLVGRPRTLFSSTSKASTCNNVVVHLCTCACVQCGCVVSCGCVTCRLSSDWSKRSDPKLAERLVLLKVCVCGWVFCGGGVDSKEEAGGWLGVQRDTGVVGWGPKRQGVSERRGSWP